MHKFSSGMVMVLVCLLPGCYRLGAPPSKTPFGDETGIHGPFNKVANVFLLDLKAGRIKDAYAHTSKDYQKDVNEDQFKAILEKNPFPTGAGSGMMGMIELDDANRRKYRYKEDLANGSIFFTFEAVKEGNEYRVEKLSLK